MLTQLRNWWICIGEPEALHKTKIEFFKKAKEAEIKHVSFLWELSKQLFPSSLAIENIDGIIASVKYGTVYRVPQAEAA